MSFPNQLLERLAKPGIVAGFSVEKAEHGVPIARALLAGGIHAIELTLRTAPGLDAVRAICAEVPEILVGVGTILSSDVAREVHAAGADFGVSPGLNPNVVKAAQDAGLPFAPGISTPSDIEAALELDCRFLKFFPAEATGGIGYLRSMSAPYNHLGIRFFPLGGINAGNMLAYLEEPNVVAIGGSWIVKGELVANGEWDALTARAKQVREMAKPVRAYE